MALEIVNEAQVLNDFVKLNDKMAKQLNQHLNLTAETISTDAKRKITADRHVVTGRLRSSIHVAYPGGDSYRYSNNIGGGFSGGLDTVVRKNERAIGTNVNYAGKIEKTDSYLLYSVEKNRQKFINGIKNIVNEVGN